MKSAKKVCLKQNMEGDKRGMEQEEKDMELVSDYLYHRLGDEERLAFEARMAVDEEFRSFYEEIRLMIRGIGSYGRRENLRKVELLESELSAGAPARVRSLKSAKRYYWLAAAAVAVIAVSSVLLTGPRAAGYSVIIRKTIYETLSQRI